MNFLSPDFSKPACSGNPGSLLFEYSEYNLFSDIVSKIMGKFTSNDSSGEVMETWREGRGLVRRSEL